MSAQQLSESRNEIQAACCVTQPPPSLGKGTGSSRQETWALCGLEMSVSPLGLSFPLCKM